MALHPHEKAARGYIALGCLELVLGVLLVGVVLADELPRAEAFRLGRLVSLALPLLGWLFIRIGKGIRAKQDWGRTWGVIFGFLMLFGIPLGTLIGAYLLLNLKDPFEITNPQPRPVGGLRR